ncbi:MAG: hypothetical protein LRY54_02685 [Alphaproteobacteria bacterium]|nr:hypothetical protein [Alphaproteobacteria bacterium]
MAKTSKVSVDQQELKRAQDMWGAFTGMTKWAIGLVIAVVVLLAATRL